MEMAGASMASPARLRRQANCAEWVVPVRMRAKVSRTMRDAEMRSKPETLGAATNRIRRSCIGFPAQAKATRLPSLAIFAAVLVAANLANIVPVIGQISAASQEATLSARRKRPS